jgi:hypothetical protein
VIEVLTYLAVLLIGYLAGRGTKQEPPPAIDNQVAELEKKIKYYKELCLWHVEEKEKLKRK